MARESRLMTSFDFDPTGISEPLAARDWWLAAGVAVLAIGALLFGPRGAGTADQSQACKGPSAASATATNCAAATTQAPKANR